MDYLEKTQEHNLLWLLRLHFRAKLLLFNRMKYSFLVPVHSIATSFFYYPHNFIFTNSERLRCKFFITSMMSRWKNYSPTQSSLIDENIVSCILLYSNVVIFWVYHDLQWPLAITRFTFHGLVTTWICIVHCVLHSDWLNSLSSSSSLPVLQ